MPSKDKPRLKPLIGAMLSGIVMGCIITLLVLVVALDGKVCGDVAMDTDDFLRLVTKAYPENSTVSLDSTWWEVEYEYRK